MSTEGRKNAVLIGLTLLFLGLAGAFLFDLWGRPLPVKQNLPTDPQFTNVATVRMSAAELIRTGGDTSGLTCYACHDEKKRVELHLDAAGKVILPKEHGDLVMRHGRNNRNDLCFNCHDSDKIDTLRTRDGRQLKVEASTQLCGSCHGPTYRDWEIGIHGRKSGYWDKRLGAAVRQDCTSCHDPHSPAFPSLTPGPGPNPLHPTAKAATRKDH
jgi:predicted CXXCH cytochrome family protein